jgi:hypothetical protein
MEPVRENRRESRDDESNRARSRVSWGENQFHHFDVPTPESYREQFVSDGDLKSREPKHAADETRTEPEAPKSDQTTSTYMPYRPEMSTVPENKEVAPSTQYVRGQEDSTWDSVVDAASKKSKKKEKKSAAVAAAAALTTAAVLSREENDERDLRDFRPDIASTLSNPFSDVNKAPSTIAPSTISASTISAAPSWTSTISPSIISAAPSSTISPSIISAAPSTSSVQTAYWQPEPERDAWRAPQQTPIGPGFVEGEVTTPPATMHMPGGWDDMPEPEVPAQESSAYSTKKDEKGKKSNDTDNSVAMQNVPRRVEATTTASAPVKEKELEPEPKSSKKDKKKKSKKASKRASVDTWEMSEPSPPTSPIVERDPRDIEPSRDPRDIEPSRDPRDIEPPRPAEVPRSADSSRYNEPSRTFESPRLGEAFQESPSTSPKKGSRQDESSGSKASTAAMAGGFAALMGMAMNQDQDRMASDLERARKNFQSTEKRSSRDSPVSPTNGARALEDYEKNVTIPSYAFEGIDELADKTPRPKAQKRHSSGKWSPSISSPLRTETKYDDYMGARTISDPSRYQTMVEAPKVPTTSPFTTAPDSGSTRNITDSGYYAPDDIPRRTSHEKESDEFYPAGYNDKEKDRRVRDDRDTDDRSDDELDDRPRRYDDDDDIGSIASLSYKYEDPDREERRRRRREAKSETREKSHDRGYDLEEGGGGERRRRHRRRETDEGDDDWDMKSTISDTRSEVPGERRRKHKRRESEKDVSPESKTRSRSTAASEYGDYDDDRKSSRRRSKRDDDMVSVVSSIPDLDEERSSRKEKEKRPSGLLGLFSSKSRENLAEASSKSSRSKDDDDEERKHRRRKHRSDRGSTYGGSDDDDMRSTISTSSRREKRSTRSRSERGDRDRTDAYDDKVHRSSLVR